MKKIILIVFLSISTLKCLSQITFKNGYFIDQSNNKTECLIKDQDWKDNPNEIKYKLNESAKEKQAYLENLKEFGIYDVTKYLRRSVKIDESSNLISELTTAKDPVYVEKDIVLKVLLEGKANLLAYTKDEITKYFYSLDDSNLKQLFYKKYIDSNDQIRENNNYKQLIFNNFKCDAITLKDIENIEYKRRDLVTFFNTYNYCVGEEYNNFEEDLNENPFHLSIRPGLNYSSLFINGTQSNILDTQFDSLVTFRLGLELEFTLPFLNNKLALFAEPTYQYYNVEEKTAPLFEVNYTSIELPIGIRHYFFLNNKAKFFISGALVVESNINSNILDESKPFLDIRSLPNFALGVGYKHNNKYSIELRYLSDRELLRNYIFWESKYSTVSVIFGYNFF